MGWDVAAELEHDLVAVTERDRGGIARDLLAVDERAHATGEGEQAVRAERLAPDGEHVAEQP